MRAFTIFSGLLLFALLPSCKDPEKGCTDIIAQNYNSEAEEEDGTCTYRADKFTGDYAGSKTCQIYISEPEFTFSISRVTGKEDEISLDHFPETGVSTLAKIDFSSQNELITIPNQHLENGLDFSEISGTGVLTGNELVIRYYRFVDQSIDTSEVIATKQ